MTGVVYKFLCINSEEYMRISAKGLFLDFVHGVHPHAQPPAVHRLRRLKLPLSISCVALETVFDVLPACTPKMRLSTLV